MQLGKIGAFGFAVKMQKLVPIALLSTHKIFRTAFEILKEIIV